MNKYFFVDIDGVLNTYPDCWLDFIYRETQKRYKTIHDAKESLSYKSYCDLKKIYRTSGYKLNLVPRAGSSHFLHMLKKYGYIVVIFTSRTIDNDLFVNLSDTINWLCYYDLVFDYILFEKEKIPYYLHICKPCYVVDDDPFFSEMYSHMCTSFLFTGDFTSIINKIK